MLIFKKFARRFLSKRVFTRKIRHKNAAKNLEDISFSIFFGCGKNKEFWPEYSPLNSDRNLGSFQLILNFREQLVVH